MKQYKFENTTNQNTIRKEWIGYVYAYCSVARISYEIVDRNKFPYLVVREFYSFSVSERIHRKVARFELASFIQLRAEIKRELSETFYQIF